MITVDVIRQRLAQESAKLRALEVADLWLYGSASRQAPEVRDLDFLVDFAGAPGFVNFMDLKFLLESIFGLPVDLHTRQSCPQRFFDRIRQDLKHVA